LLHRRNITILTPLNGHVIFSLYFRKTELLVNNNDPNFLLTSVYRKKTFTGLLTNYFSFTWYSYKVGLIRTLADRAYKINNTWLGLHEDITKLMDIPAHLIERVVNRYVTGTLSNHSPRVSLPSSPTFYFKLPYIGHFSVVTQKRVRHLIKRCTHMYKGGFWLTMFFHHTARQSRRVMKKKL